jgi:methylated-DNA-[protein]-cysteine S-methyltransferase
MSVTSLAASRCHAVLGSPIGELTMVCDDRGILGLYFPSHWTEPDPASFGPRADRPADRGFDQAETQLDEYFAGQRTAFDLPLVPIGSELARRVWALIAAIPYGRTTTYGALADEIGNGISARAIGGFVGHNPLSIFVPCHRVVGSNGHLTGYAGGLERKRHLLELEQALPVGARGLW